ncbi:hypothetical protein LU11_gp276 [Pseudomonas phage Lu11]|uniref:hypothetical protein n=1 Tax=Pseudomonas phage Lu11 TaxID=1161927 RepID=UPI00025F183B|nr:hypothetical protein LU11_gp276 [Pseudomonas phage Lu11]AFH14807.1 hypothetical protein Lu11_0270 [Pseudomonas phage Lu11]
MRILALFLLVVLSMWIYSAFKYAWQHSRSGAGDFAVMVLLGFVLSAAEFAYVAHSGLGILAQKIRQKFNK